MNLKGKGKEGPRSLVAGKALHATVGIVSYTEQRLASLLTEKGGSLYPN